MITLVILPSPRACFGAAALCSCTVRAAIFSCNASRIGWLFWSSFFIHSGTWSAAKVRGFHQFFTGSIPWLTIKLRPWASKRSRALTNCSRCRWMARSCSSFSVGTRTRASAARLPCTKRSNFKHSALASSPSVFTLRFCSSNFCGQNHVTVDPQRTQVALQSKTKPARFIDGVHLVSLLLKFGCPEHKGFFFEALRRLGVAPAQLFDHHVKILVHINSKLDHTSATIKLAAGFLE